MRDWLRRWLGIDDLATRSLIAAAEKAQRERHEELIGKFGIIAQLFQHEHLKRPPKPVFAQDWEGVQAEQLMEMLTNQPKEEN